MNVKKYFFNLLFHKFFTINISKIRLLVSEKKYENTSSNWFNQNGFSAL